MSEAKHTPGNLLTEKMHAHHDQYHDIWSIEGESDVVADPWRMAEDTHVRHPHMGDESEAYCKRLVACWNAMDGIADPAALRRERDELLVLLKGIMCGVRRQHDGECSYTLLPECEQACLEIIRKAGDRHG